MEKNCTMVTTLKGTEYIRALAEDGSTVRIPVAELGKIMAQVMPVATNNTKGLIPSMPYNWGPTPGIASLGYLDFQTDINNDENQYCSIEVDIHGIYGHNGRSLQDIHLSVIISEYKLSKVYHASDMGNGTRSIESIILYKGSDGYIHVIINVNNQLNVSGGYLSISVFVNKSLNVNRVVKVAKYKEIDNYVDGTNSEEIKCVIDL